MSHASLLLLGPCSDLAAALDEDGRPDSTADFTAYECPDHGEYERLDHQSQECPQCGKQGEPI